MKPRMPGGFCPKLGFANAIFDKPMKLITLKMRYRPEIESEMKGGGGGNQR